MSSFRETTVLDQATSVRWLRRTVRTTTSLPALARTYAACAGARIDAISATRHEEEAHISHSFPQLPPICLAWYGVLSAQSDGMAQREELRGLEMSEKASFGALLKHYRVTAGLSQEMLAARAGLSARSISDLERGINRAPRYATLELLSSALALSAQQRALLQASAHPDLFPSVDAADAPPARSALGIPLPATRLVGREQERSRALALLRGEVRLLSLTGPSGVGKTRLALQLAWDLAPDFTDGAVYTPLAPIHDPMLVPSAVAQALGLRERGDSLLPEQVAAFLRQKRLLLVLDNVEQVLESAPFVAELLARCPHLCILATSRTPLHVRAERELPLTPLPIGDAVKLFRERAQAVRPDGAYEEGEVAPICERVDRLPLAIELAAIYVRTLSLPDLQARLTHRLALLRGGARDLPARQQTMEAAIAWSYDLLTDRQQRCFRALGVFVGGWTLEAAAMVAFGEGEMAPEELFLTLAALADASLVQAEIAAGGMTRFSMLELIREYALGQLRATGEEDACRRRHAAYYSRLADTIMAYFGPGQGTRDAHFAAALVPESPNVRSALHWAEERRDAELGLHLVGFTRLWHVRGQTSEAVRWTERMLALDFEARQQGQQAAPLTLRLHRLYGVGRMMVRQGKLEPSAEAFAQEALRLAQSIGDRDGICNALETLGMIAQAGGKLDEAEAMYAESHSTAELMEDRGLMSRALSHLGEVAGLRGDAARATALLEEGESFARAVGMTWDIPILKTWLGHIARQQRDFPRAKARYREALTLYRAFASPTYIAACLDGCAATACAEGCYEQATRLCAAAMALREQAQAALLPAERETFERVSATARAALGESTFAREWAAGGSLTQDAAIEAALSDCTPSSSG
jgi:predicted ATPase/DNA-binding XRE family transcriptional regulator